ncbi:hypothetical protein L210DRAFT_984966 [Boletus edulis BED1]|uniref:Uncharacterized protein n=1 Tax=Boletus edulis BED1 TaxID=1328754 RepID=A0AAD4BTA9_BOLED|nr:hypothetical protein L210DRAFT_984966 [Boletus edulis BED1]
MSAYVELIGRDVSFREPSEDASSWPSSVSQLVQSLRNELKLPGWLKSGPIPYINQRAVGLIDQLRASADASNVDLWDAPDKIIDKDTEQRLNVVFNSALVDCARVQAVVQAENFTGTPYPKESFLVILVRTAIWDALARLSCLEEVPVVLPRHFSGEAVPILNYMAKSIYVPLVVSICQEMPAEESAPEVDHQSSDESEEDSTVGSESSGCSPPTLSEWLDAPPTNKPEEVEEEPAQVIPPPQFEAYFFAYRPSMVPPPTCHIPVMCMADEEQIPVLMSSLLYQRRVWHISDPLVGLEFSKYDTVIRLFVGWLEDDLSSDRALPRVHLLEVETPVTLDLASPSVALMVSRMFFGLEPYISGIRDAAKNSVDKVFSETQTRSPFSWRIDTDVQHEETSSVESDDIREKVRRWAKNQSCSEEEE